ncbi:uncharacterized protein UV8b_06172 [Ustilaginoidea virens]|uniref:Uncharacterized protein n=1 Tax=Ustilaginoidea virens TaxID=1159556 RepID=A0A8E5MJD2_USTVR|nr:uncharacterized protein UV8b_06172 [Ustilaginoidea virens]QUC21931.1 hypothetical protein UV8b_06172 [Ustilaginoidea virens]
MRNSWAKLKHQTRPCPTHMPSFFGENHDRGGMYYGTMQAATAHHRQWGRRPDLTYSMTLASTSFATAAVCDAATLRRFDSLCVTLLASSPACFDCLLDPLGCPSRRAVAPPSLQV